MRFDARTKTTLIAPATCLLAALLAAACGDEVDPQDEMDASTDTDTDSDTDSDTSYTCTQDEIDAQNAAIQAALTEAVPCFTGGIVPMVESVQAYFMAAPDEPSLVLCEDFLGNATAEELLEEGAALALADDEFLCIGNSTDVSGGSAVDVAALRAAIDAVTEPADPPADAGVDAGPVDPPCAVEGLDDPLFVVSVAADGGLSDVFPADEDTSPETAEYAACLAAQLAELGLPCLATMGICSAYP
ncbi:MAG: hypothetical protein M0R80_07270 [Proteobacteria bacterium]|jgi:hypothetical protein|nr:hypothetical protein [Pseudomonadota bacterium]